MSNQGLKLPFRKLSNMTRLLLILCAGLAAGAAAVFLDNPFYVLVGLVGVIVLFITLRTPEIGLFALVFMTYIRLSDVLIEYHGLPSIAKLYLPFLIGLLLYRWLFHREEPQGWVRALIVLTLYGVVIGGSVIYAGNSSQAESGFIDYIKDALIALVIVVMLQRGAVLRRVIWALLFAGIFLGTLTTIQAATGTYEFEYWGFGSAEIRNIAGEVNDYRVQGPVSSNYYAMFLVVLVPLALDRLWHERSKVMRGLAAWALVVCSVSILFTFSRGGLLALLVVLGLMLVRHPPRLWVTLTGLAGIILMLLLTPSEYLSRIGNLTQVISIAGGGEGQGSQLEENALRGRLSEMTVAAQMFGDYPILGVGYNNFEVNYLDYSPEIGLDSRREGRAAHSLYLEIAAETGIIGLSVFSFIMIVYFHGLWQSYRRFSRVGFQDYADITAAFAIGVLGFLICSVFLHSAYPRYFWLLVGIGLAIPQIALNETSGWFTSYKQQPEELSEKNSRIMSNE